MSEQKNTQQHAEEALYAFRRELLQRQWFRESPTEVKSKVLALPMEWIGLLQELVEKPEEIEGVRLLHLHQFRQCTNTPYSAHLEWGFILPNQKTQLLKGIVREVKGATGYYREAFTWRRGKNAGGKGVVLVQDVSETSLRYVLLLHGISLAAWERTYDCPGGGREPGETDEETFRRETEEEMGIKEFQRVYSLGPYLPEQSMTSMKPTLFAGIISHGVFMEQVQIGKKRGANLDHAPNTEIIPIEDLWGENGFICQNPEGYFNACMAKLIARGILRPPS